jgi:hypothetical protein
VLQYNKRDLPNALPIEILNERMNPRDHPWQEAVAVKGVGVEDTLKAVTKLVFKSLSARYGEGGAPLRQSSPARQASGPPLPPSASADDLLSELAPPSGYTPGPSRVTPLAQPGSLPPIELDPTPPPREPVRSAPPPVEPARPAPRPVAPAPAKPAPAPAPVAPAAARTVNVDIPTRPPVPPEPPPRPPVGAHPPQSTLITKRDEAEDLRRHISTPGIAASRVPDDPEMELEELDELEPSSAPVPVRPATPVPPRPPTPASPPFERAVSLPPPPPADELEPESEAEVSEVEVPIDIEVAPGTTRLTLNLKLVLSFRRR